MVAEASFAPPRLSAPPETVRPGRFTAARNEALHDAALVARFNDGDDDAFDEIIVRYHEKVSVIAFGVLHNHADAEEIAQDTMIRAHRCLHAFRGTCSLSTWLHTIALNLARNRYWYFSRRRRQMTQSLDCAMSEDTTATFTELAASDAPGPVGEAITREFTAVVAECIEKLTPHHRGILERRILQNCTYDEIAEALDLRVGTVKSRIARARESLRALLAIQCPEFTPQAAPMDWFDPARSAGGLRRT